MKKNNSVAECLLCFNCKMCKGWQEVQCSKDHWDGKIGEKKTLELSTIKYHPSKEFIKEHKGCPDFIRI